MSRIAQRISGCYRRVLLFLIAILLVCIGIGAIVYSRVGGLEGARYWMAERALNGTEKHLLTNRPDGIPQEQVVTLFKRVRDANKNRQVDLIALYKVLEAYQVAYKALGSEQKAFLESKKLSTPEVEVFLSELEKTIFSE